MNSSSGSSPAIDELLADPLVQLVIQADSLDVAWVSELYCRVAAAISPSGAPPAASSKSTSSPFVGQDHAYRSGVGVMLLNRSNQVFVGQRIWALGEAWQMPQGGIDEGERPAAAALRELREEIGTDNVELLGSTKEWLRYDLPPDLVGTIWGGKWRGQQQKWFAARFKGSDAEINIATEHPEFSAWQWISADQLPELIVSFKRQLYAEIVREFRAVIAPEPGVRRQT